MTNNNLPMFGTGSQPGESDGAELDYIRMPSEMSTYMSPPVPEADEALGLDQAKALLEKLLVGLRYYSGQLEPPLFLRQLDTENLNLVNQVLGEGDVSIVFDTSPQTVIQESVLVGVWRVQSVDEFGEVLSDHIEVANIPWLIRKDTFSSAQEQIATQDLSGADGVMNAPSLISEINNQIHKQTDQEQSHTINLSLLPQTEQDLNLLSEVLGGGKVIILSRGYGNCRITSTNTQNVWWVQYFNSQDTMILNTLEITHVPAVACAAKEDIPGSAERLNDILEVYR